MESRRAISIVEYDSAWPAAFEALRAPVWEVVRDIAIGIEHVGSTSVPGLAAKPIIDMDVVVRSRVEIPVIVERLAALGYVHQGNLGIAGREAFKSPQNLPAHHLYVCCEGSEALLNHLTVRDYLRAHSSAAVAYGELKRRLAGESGGGIDPYVQGKTDFLLELLRKAGFDEGPLDIIRNANRAKPY